MKQLIYVVKERNRYLAALKKIDGIVSASKASNNTGQDLNLVGDLCKTAIASPSRINAEINKAMPQIKLQ